jgi:hypothetical protein
MLTTVLLILKILGIVLLCIIGFLLLIIALILFVPIRYKGNASKADGRDNPLCALAGVSWLLHIISASYEYKGGKTQLIIKIFGIRLRSREEREEKRRKKKSRKDAGKRKKIKEGHIFGKNGEKKTKTGKRRKDEEPEYTIYEYDKDGNEIRSEAGSNKSKTSVYVEEHEEGLDIEYPAGTDDIDKQEDVIKQDDLNIQDDINKQDDHNKQIITNILERMSSAAHKLSGRFKRISQALERTSNRVSGMIDNLDYYYNALFNDSRNGEVLRLLTAKVKRLIKAVRPRKVKGYLDFGSEDPSTTGRVLACAAVMYPVYGRSIAVNPDFENERFDFDLELKGRIYLCVVAKILIQLYFNRKVKRFIRIMKKESNANG